MVFANYDDHSQIFQTPHVNKLLHGFVLHVPRTACLCAALPERPAVAEFDQFLKDLFTFLELLCLLGLSRSGALTHLQKSRNVSNGSSRSN